MSHMIDSLANLPFEWARYEFMRNALLAVILVSPLFALMGTLVVNNRMAFFSDAIGHASLTGIGLGSSSGWRILFLLSSGSPSSSGLASWQYTGSLAPQWTPSFP